MVLTNYLVLSPVTGLFATVVSGYRRQLDASIGASGPHAFAVREPARSSARSLASTTFRPASVTTAKRPFKWDGTTFRIIQSFDLVK
jgi:hypothetical protein